jgi:lipid II:glycine glycyltransferase (peptidoglycan interpeptide bridge formation enzyme)
MTWGQILETTSVIQADFFLAKNSMQQDIASAIVFHVREREIVQVIYWGDKPEYSEHKTMNYLSFKVFEYYKHAGFKYVDIGPSSENSLPNYGLCEFKESIGCFISPKITMAYQA